MWGKHCLTPTNYRHHKNDILAVGQINTFQGENYTDDFTRTYFPLESVSELRGGLHRNTQSF